MRLLFVISEIVAQRQEYLIAATHGPPQKTPLIRAAPAITTLSGASQTSRMYTPHMLLGLRASADTASPPCVHTGASLALCTALHVAASPALQLPLRKLILDQDLGYIDQAAMSGEAAGGDSCSRERADRSMCCGVQVVQPTSACSSAAECSHAHVSFIGLPMNA